MLANGKESIREIYFPSSFLIILNIFCWGIYKQQMVELWVLCENVHITWDNPLIVIGED